jgi:RNA polymerase sigma factor (TIGR02999 family)
LSIEIDDEVYAHLRRLASRIGNSDGGFTLNPTSLVHEAWEKLAKSRVQTVDRTHVVALSARAMRQILVDRARARGSQKRGGDRHRTTLSGLAVETAAIDVLELDQALEQLSELDAVAADVVVLRTFGGLTIEEVAAELECSRRYVNNKWSFGRAFLLSVFES